MNKLSLAVAASLLALGTTACKQEPAAQNDNPAAAPVQAPNGDWSKLVSATTEGGMLMGNPQAKVKVVEFGSMTCHVCAEFATKDEAKLVDNYVKTGNVSFEFRNFVRDPLDIAISLVTRCAGATPQFFTLTNGIYADQKSFFDRIQAVPQDQLAQLQSLAPAQQFSRMAQLAGVQEWAAQRGLPSGKTSQCLANQAEIDRIVQMNSDASSTYDIPGTPTFLVDGEEVKPTPNQGNWDALEAAIKAAQ
ncbi:protein-disulfide isomerase [Sphingomonas kaistensis]|uniref:Protein-disulfide isomerase n=1 Tax=Sphingomonas kaistensis TaxID=298708 RepID=A0A7X5Y818_9SPHN|nr:thioredoxin domain-containing protein [Sphingomonas kaistensis]NJC05231.1 protein-disulfide isomerase [Sphingomonas kaistensis]